MPTITITLDTIQTAAITAFAAARGKSVDALLVESAREVVAQAVAAYETTLKERAAKVWRDGSLEQRAALVAALQDVESP